MNSRASTCAASMPRSRNAAAIDAAREPLAVAHNQVGDARREFQNRGQPAQNFVERVEFLVDPGDQRGRVFLILHQRARRVAMARAQPRTDGQRAGAVALRCRRGGAQQLVGHLGHGAHYHHGLLALGHAPGHNGRGAPNRRRIFDRRAAELHHYQIHVEDSHIDIAEPQGLKPIVFLGAIRCQG